MSIKSNKVSLKWLKKINRKKAKKGKRKNYKALRKIKSVFRMLTQQKEITNPLRRKMSFPKG